MTTLTGPAAEVRRRPSTRGYWLAAALALVGVLGAGAWVFASYARAAADPAAFTRVATTGPAAVTIDRAGTYAVYYEAPYGMMMGSAPGMSVTGPDGRTLAMRPGYGMRYAVPGRPGCFGRMAGRFRADRPGRYQMMVGRPDAQATIALAPDTNHWLLPSLFGAVAFLVLTTGAAVVVALTTASCAGVDGSQAEGPSAAGVSL